MRSALSVHHGGPPVVEVEFGYAAGQHYETCAHVVGAERMVCGRKVGRIAVSIEEAPADLHPRCRDLLAAGVELRGPLCPVCGGRVPVVDGRVGRHGSCVGVNLPPKQGQS